CIHARLAWAEAALRSRLDLALDERQSRGERRLSDEASEHRRRLDSELGAALRGARTELGRGLARERDAMRRELSATARADVAAAAGRIDQLHSAAIRDAVLAAEAVTASRLHAVRESLGGDIRR